MVDFSYREAFSRNIGILTETEQETLRNSTVGVAGLGGTGGVDFMNLVRLGVGGFHIADCDKFELANFNRQHGAMLSTVGKEKVEVMKAAALDVNPELRLKCFSEGITESNMDSFLDGISVLVDGLDFFALNVRRELFRRARERNIWIVTAGPHGASTGWLVFSPQGMSFEDYFDFRSAVTEIDQIIAFAVGLVPRAIHLTYLDLATLFRPQSGRAASLGLACALSAGVVAAQTLKILLKRGKIFAAPAYFQFDAYEQRLARGYLFWGNRHPLQKYKRRWLKRKLGGGKD